MANFENAYAGIKALVNVINPAFNANAIYQAYNNNITYQDDAFVIITLIDTRQMGITPFSSYDTDTETQSFENIQVAWFQVDFYGTGSGLLGGQMKLYLTSFDCTDWLNYNYSCTVGEVHEQKKVSGDFDRGKYKERFTLRFSLFCNTNFSITSYGFASDDVIVKLADIQT